MEKSRFTASNEITIHEKKNWPFTNHKNTLCQTGTSSGTGRHFSFEDLFRRRGKRTPSHPTPTHSVWNILYLFCTSHDTADTSHERNFFQFTWRQNILLQGNGLVFYDTPQGRKIVTIGNEMLICSSKNYSIEVSASSFKFFSVVVNIVRAACFSWCKGQ